MLRRKGLFCGRFLASNFRNASDRMKQTHFGYQAVDEDEKAGKVAEVFSSVAEKYDLMNDAMSCGLHRCWKKDFVSQLNVKSSQRFLDVAGGTGDVAFSILRELYRPGQEIPRRAKDTVPAPSLITVCDINQSMLDVGRGRAQEKGVTEDQINWICGDAEQLPFRDAVFDVYTIAFGIRNCTNIDKVLSEAYRVLKPNGRFACLEFSTVQNKCLSWFYDLYSFQVIPPLGQLIAADWKSYQYLVESIRRFPNQEHFSALIKAAKFEDVHFKNMTGGIVAAHFGTKRTTH